MNIFKFTVVALIFLSSCAPPAEKEEKQGLVFNTTTSDIIVKELVAIPKNQYEKQKKGSGEIPDGAVLMKRQPVVEKKILPEPDYDLSKLKAVLASMKLPSDLLVYLDSLEIKYMPLEHSALSKEVAGYSYGEYSQTQIVNDFDGDSRDDYALLVNNRGTIVSVVVFLKREDSYTHRVIMDMYYGENHDKNDIKMIMIPVAESVKGIEGTLELENGGLYVKCAYCPGSAVYYWDEGNFAIFPTSD